jgi:hypothetical protein
MNRTGDNPKHHFLTDKEGENERTGIPSQQDPFIVPEGYFDELPSRVMNKIERQKSRPKAMLTFTGIIRNAWVPAALVTIAALIFFYEQPPQKNKNSTPLNSLVTSAPMNEYDPEYAEEALLIEEAGITEKDENQIDMNSMCVSLLKSDTASISNEEKIQFLLDENYDTEIIADL